MLNHRTRFSLPGRRRKGIKVNYLQPQWVPIAANRQSLPVWFENRKWRHPFKPISSRTGWPRRNLIWSEWPKQSRRGGWMEENGDTRETLLGIVVSLSSRFRLTISSAFFFFALQRFSKLHFCQLFSSNKNLHLYAVCFLWVGLCWLVECTWSLLPSSSSGCNQHRSLGLPVFRKAQSSVVSLKATLIW